MVIELNIIEDYLATNSQSTKKTLKIFLFCFNRQKFEEKRKTRRGDRFYLDLKRCNLFSC
jgi:hypothetical protein